MLRLLAAVASFGIAFLLAIPALVKIHTFFADVPFDPLLGEGGVAVLLYFYFAIAALGAGASLSLQGISARRMFVLGLVDLGVLLIAIEAYILFIDRFAARSGTLYVVIAVVFNFVLVAIFFRVALCVAHASNRTRNSRSHRGSAAV
jgi:hypothetical protein